MKIFGCTVQVDYGGGIILVAANTVEEAFLFAATSKIDYVFDWYDENGYIEPDGNINHVSSDVFPFESWKEYTEICTNVTEPTILISEFYYE